MMARDVIAEMFARGSLPRVIETTAAWGSLSCGTVLQWSDEQSGFLSLDENFCVWAHLVRGLWGSVFAEAVILRITAKAG
jgi:hypothetical protein